MPSSSRLPICHKLLFVALVVAISCVHVSANKECEQLGFTGLQSCADCESMAEYVKDEELVSDCKKCCVKQAEGNTKYTQARLEVCPFRLNGLPSIQDFVDNHSQQYGKALKIVRTVGAYPSLTLSHKKTGARTSVRIDQWKVPTIHEYLQGKLESYKGKNKVETSK